MEDKSELVACYGLPAEEIATQKKDWGREGGTQAISPVIHKLEDPEHSAKTRELFSAYAEFPLIFSNERIGVLKGLSKDTDFFSKNKQLLIQPFVECSSSGHSKQQVVNRVAYDQ